MTWDLWKLKHPKVNLRLETESLYNGHLFNILPNPAFYRLLIYRTAPCCTVQTTLSFFEKENTKEMFKRRSWRKDGKAFISQWKRTNETRKLSLSTFPRESQLRFFSLCSQLSFFPFTSSISQVLLNVY